MVARVCGAIIKDGRILMVHHQEGERSYWTLPGGGVEAGERPYQAVVREVEEETGVQSQVSRFLFDQPFRDDICRCFLMEVEEGREAALGYDPEQAHLQSEARMLQGIAWHTLESMKDDCQVSEV